MTLCEYGTINKSWPCNREALGAGILCSYHTGHNPEAIADMIVLEAGVSEHDTNTVLADTLKVLQREGYCQGYRLVKPSSRRSSTYRPEGIDLQSYGS